MTGVTFGQGSLTPPGVPAPTMKTLDELNTAVADVSDAVGLAEPRTPLVESSPGVTVYPSGKIEITQSGSYYLTSNLASTSDGVVITASGVTLDLMGFTLSGDRGSSDKGVFLDGATNSPLENIVVKNGTVHNFGEGIYAEYCQGNRFKHLILGSNSYRGIYLYGSGGQCDGNTISDCTIQGNGSYSIYLRGSGGQCDGNTISDCTINGNGNIGIYLYGYGGQCNGNTILDSTIQRNESYGIYLSGAFSGQCDGNTITDCTVNGNANRGIYLYGYNGQCAGNMINDCTIQKNTDMGIYLNYSDGNRVERNHITGQTGSDTKGLRCTGSENLVFCNTCVGQTNNFVFFSSNVYGPIVTTSGELSTTGAGAHPLANFSF